MTSQQVFDAITDKLNENPWSVIDQAIDKAWRSAKKTWDRHPDASVVTRLEHSRKAARNTFKNLGITGDNCHLIVEAILSEFITTQTDDEG